MRTNIVTAALISSAVFAFGLLTGAPVARGQAQGEHPPVSFVEHVQPILQKNCAKCHDKGKAKGGFSIKSRKAMLEDGEAVIPGKASESYLIELVTESDPELRMPSEGDALTAKQIAMLKLWIDQGAKWDGQAGDPGTDGYVAPLKPRRPPLPEGEFARANPIDRFLAVYSKRNNITPAPLVDDATFIRRAHLDLVGLLPTADASRAFVKNTATGKRADLVRRLLADNREYTEHWLTFWNDHLRNDYAGTGYIDGGRRQITNWLYASLYNNKPYDQFARELVNPTGASAGFANGLKWRGRVNASQATELQYSQSVAQVFLGINMKCASCHDSFIDKWTLEDAYGLAAIYANRPLELHRCDIPTGKKAVPRFVFDELGQIDPAADRKQRLEQFAKLLTHPDNGRLQRTIVNRLWARLMGRGIVEPVDVMANRPWDEDLLDFLAVYLAHHKYDLKQVIELIATSQAYQRQAVAAAAAYKFRGPAPKRLTAEQFTDAVWQLTGTGPGNPSAKISGIDFAKNKSAAVQRPKARAAMVTSTMLMRALGRPNREQIVTTRPDTLTTLEALELTNGEVLAKSLADGAKKIAAQHKDNPGGLVDSLYLRLLCRPPSPAESKAALQFLGAQPENTQVEDLLWTLLLSPEFQLIN